MRNIKSLPKFKYHPNLYKSDIVTFKKGVCQCCGEKVRAFISEMYCAEEIDCICLPCVANGKAAEKFDGQFVEGVEKEVSDSGKTDELLKRTPGYPSWQGEYWLTCCDDYCAYLGTVVTKNLEKMGIADQVIAEYEARGEIPDIRKNLVKKSSLCGYLFQCLHCGKHHLWVDID